MMREPSQASDISPSGPAHVDISQRSPAGGWRGPPARTLLPHRAMNRAPARSPSSQIRETLVRSKAARFGRHGMLSAEGHSPPSAQVVHVGRPVAGQWQTNDERTDARAARMSYASSDSRTRVAEGVGRAICPYIYCPGCRHTYSPDELQSIRRDDPCHCPH